mmetsp:Transcript_41632/g.50662  ORF Transcript_41632/g.50662 Transcript_41632/m.50662 type:complete len:202 (+) Transcript_41632:1416-2021(+)
MTNMLILLLIPLVLSTSPPTAPTRLLPFVPSPPMPSLMCFCHTMCPTPIVILMSCRNWHYTNILCGMMMKNVMTCRGMVSTGSVRWHGVKRSCIGGSYGIHLFRRGWMLCIINRRYCLWWWRKCRMGIVRVVINRSSVLDEHGLSRRCSRMSWNLDILSGSRGSRRRRHWLLCRCRSWHGGNVGRLWSVHYRHDIGGLVLL